MAVETYKVYVYRCDCEGCEIQHLVEDRGGDTGGQPENVFTGTTSYTSTKGFVRVYWVACRFEHIAGAVISTVNKSLGN